MPLFYNSLEAFFNASFLFISRWFLKIAKTVIIFILQKTTLDLFLGKINNYELPFIK